MSVSGKDKPLLTLGERLFGTLAVLLSAFVLLYGAWKLNGDDQRALFDAEADGVARHLDGAVDELDTLLTTLVGMHYADSGTDDLVAFAADILRQLPSVTSIGRYASVDASDRDDFERAMADSGLYAFRITEIDESGRARTRERSAHHHPISLLEPMSPARLRLLGADLDVVDGLGTALDRIAANDQSLITTLPAHWPAGGELLLFHATYRGKHVPTDLGERLRQADGGFWLAASPAALLEDIAESTARFDLTLSASDPEGVPRTLLERGAEAPRELFGRSLYPRQSVERRRTLGRGELVLVLEADLGAPAGLFVALAAALSLVIFAVLAGAAYVRNRRLSGRERERGLHALQAERERADRTLNAIDDAVFALDTSQRVLHMNPAAARLSGDARERVLGRPLGAVLTLRDAADGRTLDLGRTLDAVDRAGPRGIDVLPAGEGSRADGAAPGEHETVLRLNMSRTLDAAGELSGHILVLRDISDERRLTRRLEYQAHHDALTGCSNRRRLEGRLGELLDELPTTGRRHALCYLDLDQFKIVNDTNGHAAGDRLLKELTGNLRSLCRKEDMLARLGGDEFGLLMVDVTEQEARRVAERLYTFFQGYVFRHGKDAFAIRASIGLVPLDERSGTVGDVLAAADLACYAAKEGGRNGLCVYSPDDEALSQRSSELNRLPELQRALVEDRFELYLQAVASIGAGTAGASAGSGVLPVSHFEFLIRLTGEDGVPIAPFRIIEAAERYGLMREIDRWVISHCLASVAAIRNGPGHDCSFSINLSGQSAADPTLMDFIEREFIRYGVDPARIWFELTETSAITHFSIAVELATRIRALGAKVALDDFGSGLSSFGYLKNIPVDVLKIDGQFVRHIVDSPIDRTMVRAIDEVSKSMGILTVAEFVEDQAIVDELVAIGIDYVQGYHIGKPLPFREALDVLPVPAPASRRAA